MRYDYDWIVVGSGFGGSVSALRLAEKGYRVAALECGRRFEDHDFGESTFRHGAAIPANPGVNPSLTITAKAEHAMSLISPNPDTGQRTLPVAARAAGEASERATASTT